MKKVFAKWRTDFVPSVEDLTHLHISCGVGDEQWDGYQWQDVGVHIHVRDLSPCPKKQGPYETAFTAPSLDLEKEEDYWLSPSLLNDKYEAVDWGIK